MGEAVVPAFEYRALEAQGRKRHCLLGNKATENELLCEVVAWASGQKNAVALDLAARDSL